MNTAYAAACTEPADTPCSGGELGVVFASSSLSVRKRLHSLLASEPQVLVVGVACCALEAWQIFQQHRPQAMVFDLQMGDGNGLDLARRIKRAAQDCVIIILTNVRGTASHQECRCLGVDYFFHKTTQFDRVAGVLHGLAITAAD